MRIISWNIMQGGGPRASGIVNALAGYEADMIVLNEFRDTKPSRFISEQLRDKGYEYQQSTISNLKRAQNSLLFASRTCFQREDSNYFNEQHRAVLCRDESSDLLCICMHVPNRGGGKKRKFLDTLASVAIKHEDVPAIIIGDANTGAKGIDEESTFFNKWEDAWMKMMDSNGWYDGFRKIHGSKRVYSWHEPRKQNGFRIDHIFATSRVIIKDVRYEWFRADSKQKLSDHAALIVDLNVKAA